MQDPIYVGSQELEALLRQARRERAEAFHGFLHRCWQRLQRRPVEHPLPAPAHS